MGRYVLIEFDDKEAAAKLKKQIDSATKNGRPFRVVGYFAKPDGPYCTCGKDTEERTKPSSLKRMPKTGWLKCQACGLYSSMVQPRNLLGVERLINPRTSKVNYKGKRSLMHYFSSISAQSRLAPGTHE